MAAAAPLSSTIQKAWTEPQPTESTAAIKNSTNSAIPTTSPTTASAPTSTIRYN